VGLQQLGGSGNKGEVIPSWQGEERGGMKMEERGRRSATRGGRKEDVGERNEAVTVVEGQSLQIVKER
jgi:hypothetical protein